jgi:hypothetical protein
MNHLKIKNITLDLTTQEPQQYGTMLLRYMGIRKNGQVPEKWVNGSYNSCWIYTFEKIETGGIIEFEFDYYDNFLKVYK